MKNNEYLVLAKNKEEELLKALEQAFCDSVDNRNLKYTVELYDDGEITTWYQAAGGNSYKVSNMEETSVCVGSFCNQYMDIENGEDETEEEWLDWYKDEYKQEEAENKLDYFIEDLSRFDNER